MLVVSLQLAVLIDADNVSPEALDGVFATIGTIGNPAVRKIYGNSNCTTSQAWTKVSIRHALSTARWTPQSKGHNATDIEMVIGAMDLLARSEVQGFCIVSSDRDFTALAIRLRAGGKLVYGFGDDKTPESFRHACDEFRILAGPARRKSAARVAAAPLPLPLTHAGRLLGEAFEACQTEGTLTLPAAGRYLKQGYPDFAARKYGSASLKKLIARCGGFVVEKLEGGQDAYRPARKKPGLRLVTPGPESRSRRQQGRPP